MIKNKNDLKRYLQADLSPFKKTKKRFQGLRGDINYYRKKFIVHLRKLEYYFNVHPKWLIHRFFHESRKNHFGRMFGWEIPINTCEEGLHLWHSNVVINDHCKVGTNASFSGNNCIGRVEQKYPIVGDNVSFGFGSVVIGDVKLGNNITIGANSTVTKSFDSGSVLAGSPAHNLKDKNNL